MSRTSPLHSIMEKNVCSSVIGSICVGLLTRLIDDHDWSIHSPFDEPDKKGVESGNNTPKFIDTRQGETPENPDICLPEWRHR